jgi:ferredoxin--NADP+ reductase
VTECTLLVAGGSLAGLSLAIEATEAGLEDVVLLDAGDQVAMPEVIDHHGLTVVHRAPVTSVLPHQGGGLAVKAGGHDFTAVAVVTEASPLFAWPGFQIPSSVADRVHLGPPGIDLRDADVLVVADGESGAELTLSLAAAGAGVVLALAGVRLDRLSRLARRRLLRLEAERRATILWMSRPEAIADVGGCPMVYFSDRHTPDLQFDHVIFMTGATGAIPPPISGHYRLGDHPESRDILAPGLAWEIIRQRHFPSIPATPKRPRAWSPTDRATIEELRDRHYNATITFFDRAHSDLWVLRVRPDHGDATHLPGQYASLGLGYWEVRADGALDSAHSWDRLIRRSYSISSRIFDSHGYLIDPHRVDDLEFYIVLVPPGPGRIPALTPRLALKKPGDRIYLGPKIAGRYSLDPVMDPTGQVLFLATGTGEAPHNTMIVELLRKGHRAPIVSAVSVRHRSDLGYLDAHRRLEERFENYHYLPLPTRDPDTAKFHLQDVIRRDLLSERLGVELDPQRTHVYLCGHPGMIGLPVWEGEAPRFPEATGVCELLHGRGFTLDRRGRLGNVHYEEYW